MLQPSRLQPVHDMLKQMNLQTPMPLALLYKGAPQLLHAAAAGSAAGRRQLWHGEVTRQTASSHGGPLSFRYACWILLGMQEACTSSIQGRLQRVSCKAALSELSL